MTPKKIFGKIHLWLGLTSGLVVFIVALSGSMLVFEEELELLFHRRQLVVEEVLSQRKTYDELAAIVQAAYPDKKIKGFTIYPDPSRSVLFSIGKKKAELWLVAVDPYTGKLLGHRDHHKRFFTQLLQLHRFLLMGKTGKAITGINCLVFVVMLISGMVIWWPSAKAAIKQRFRIKWKAKFKRVNWDFHAVFGFYSFIFLLVIATTGMVMSQPWANKMIFMLSDGKPPERPKNPANISPAGTAEVGIYEKIVSATNRQYAFPGEIRVNVSLEDSLGINVFKEDQSKLPNVSSTVSFDRRSGEVLRMRPYDNESAGTKVRRLIKPIHTGGVYGWPTKIIALIVSLFAASLPVTGTMIWLGRKKKAKRKAGNLPGGVMVEKTEVVREG